MLLINQHITTDYFWDSHLYEYSMLCVSDSLQTIGQLPIQNLHAWFLRTDAVAVATAKQQNYSKL